MSVWELSVWELSVWGLSVWGLSRAPGNGLASISFQENFYMYYARWRRQSFEVAGHVLDAEGIISGMLRLS